MPSSRAEVTQLLQQWSDGRHDARDQLFPVIYDELRRLAAGYMRRERARPVVASEPSGGACA